LGPGVRLDTHLYEGYRVPPFYDSLLAKLIVHGSDRAQALARARRALSEFELEGVHTTRELFVDICSDAEFLSGAYSTSYLEHAGDRLPALQAREAA
ncbi:MAG TPA: hypothetical protein VMU66_08205, partial [Gaiellales bacterium]|nr:hypothetical protein [Gaiellales bacterium]